MEREVQTTLVKKILQPRLVGVFYYHILNMIYVVACLLVVTTLVSVITFAQELCGTRFEYQYR